MTTGFTHLIDTDHEVSTLVDLLSYRSQNQSDQTAYTFLEDGETEAGRLTYQELDRLARAIAFKLQSLDAVGSRALLLYQPGLEFIAAFFGCLYAGVVAVPAYPPRRNQNMSRLQAVVTDAQAVVALTTTSLLDNIEGRFAENPELAKLHWLTTDNIAGDLAQVWQAPEVSSETLAFLQYTSGSTGTPKGVMVSHGNLLHNSALINECFADTPNSRGVSWLPPYHDMG
jgi:acyl-CoA synthetase (AMP-forming)/AMP-acid ligase II